MNDFYGNNVRGPSGRPVRRGRYPCVVRRATLTETQRSRHPAIRWDFEIIGGPHDGAILRMSTSFDPEKLWMMMEILVNLEAIHQPEIEICFDDETGDVLTPQVVGKTGILVV